MFYGWVKSCRLPVGHNEKRVHIAIYGNMHASIAGGDFYLTPGIRRGEGGGKIYKSPAARAGSCRNRTVVIEQSAVK